MKRNNNNLTSVTKNPVTKKVRFTLDTESGTSITSLSSAASSSSSSSTATPTTPLTASSAVPPVTTTDITTTVSGTSLRSSLTAAAQTGYSVQPSSGSTALAPAITANQGMITLSSDVAAVASTTGSWYGSSSSSSSSSGTISTTSTTISSATSTRTSAGVALPPGHSHYESSSTSLSSTTSIFVPGTIGVLTDTFIPMTERHIQLSYANTPKLISWLDGLTLEKVLYAFNTLSPIDLPPLFDEIRDATIITANTIEYTDDDGHELPEGITVLEMYEKLALVMICVNIPTLHTLDLSYTSGGDKGVKMGADELENQELWVNIAELVARSKLQTLKMGCSYFSEGTLGVRVAEKLVQARKLTYLDMSASDISGEEAIDVIKILQRSSSLTNLDFSENIFDTGALFQILRQLANPSTLKRIDLRQEDKEHYSGYPPRLLKGIYLKAINATKKALHEVYEEAFHDFSKKIIKLIDEYSISMIDFVVFVPPVQMDGDAQHADLLGTGLEPELYE